MNRQSSNLYVCNINIESGFTAGTYYWTVSANDSAGNIGTSTNIGQLSVDAGDDTAPTVSNISYSPSSVNVSDGSKTITVSADVNDSQNLIEYVKGYLFLPGGGVLGDCTALEPSNPSGNGRFSCTITVPSTQVSTTLKARIAARDQAGNWGSVDSGYDITVTNTSGDDTAPTVSNISYSPSSVNVSDGSKTITVSADVNDSQNLIEYVKGYLFLPGGGVLGDCTALEPSNPSGNGRFSCTITVPSTQVSTTLKARIAARDQAGNWGWVDSGYDITVTNDGWYYMLSY